MASWLTPFPDLPSWRVCITEVDDGNLSFRYEPTKIVSQARQAVADRLGLEPEAVLTLSLDVSYGVCWLERMPAGNSMLHTTGWPAEGVWQSAKQAALFLLVADCYPVAAFDPISKRLGVFHAGRPELQAGLLEKWMELGRSKGVDPAQCRVFMGPGICPRHYVFNNLPGSIDSRWERYIYRQESESQVDLSKYLVDSLLAGGIKPTNLVRDSRCTFSSNELFSHRRSKATGQPERRFALLTEVLR